MITISRATESDIPDLVKLLNVLFRQEKEFEENAELESKGLHAIIADPKTGVIIVAKQDQKIVGMVNLLFTQSTALGARVAILEDMIVSITSRAKGVGSKLMSRGIQLAKEQGCARITLLVDRDNQQAQDFYEHFGFKASSMIPYRLMIEEEEEKHLEQLKSKIK
jgi:ribosomal protein S18 acetylase RimI-like enzyme